MVQDPVLHRALTNDTDLYDWRQLVVAGNLPGAKGSVSLTIEDTASSPAWEVRLLQTWPSHYAVSSLGTPATIFEDATLAAEELAHLRRAGDLPAQSGLGSLEHDGETDLFVTMNSVGSSNAVVVFTPGGGGPAVKLAGSLEQDLIVLRRGLSDSTGWADWRQMVDAGNIAGARQHVVLRLLDETAAEIARFNLLNAWPAGYSIGFENGVAVEQLVLVHEGFELQ